MSTSDNNLLGIFLKDRRARLDPTTFGFDSARRRTPGLRREEVALRAHVSAAWYTWLEQGRGGAPSAEVLDRVANALLLTPAEREHMFLLALQRPPPVRHGAPEIVSPRLQRVLDAMEYSPALVKTSAWDIVAWNRAAQAVLADYAKLAPEQRNILRLIFTNSAVRAKMSNWERDARAALATFRLESMRGGSSDNAKALVHELCESSPEFAAMWIGSVPAYPTDRVETYGLRNKAQDACAGWTPCTRSATQCREPYVSTRRALENWMRHCVAAPSQGATLSSSHRLVPHPILQERDRRICGNRPFMTYRPTARARNTSTTPSPARSRWNTPPLRSMDSLIWGW